MQNAFINNHFIIIIIHFINVIHPHFRALLKWLLMVLLLYFTVSWIVSVFILVFNFSFSIMTILIFIVLSIAIHFLICALVFITTPFPFMFVNLVNMLLFRVGFFPFLPILLGTEIFRVNVAAAAAATIATTTTIATTAITASTATFSITAFLLFQFPFFFFTIFPL